MYIRTLFREMAAFGLVFEVSESQRTPTYSEPRRPSLVLVWALRSPRVRGNGIRSTASRCVGPQDLQCIRLQG